FLRFGYEEGVQVSRFIVSGVSPFRSAPGRLQNNPVRNKPWAPFGEFILVAKLFAYRPTFDTLLIPLALALVNGGVFLVERPSLGSHFCTRKAEGKKRRTSRTQAPRCRLPRSNLEYRVASFSALSSCIRGRCPHLTLSLCSGTMDPPLKNESTWVDSSTGGAALFSPARLP